MDFLSYLARVEFGLVKYILNDSRSKKKYCHNHQTGQKIAKIRPHTHTHIYIYLFLLSSGPVG